MSNELITIAPTAEQKMESALIAKRQEWYGLAWGLVDWYGIAVHDIPEPQRSDLNRWVRNS